MFRSPYILSLSLAPLLSSVGARRAAQEWSPQPEDEGSPAHVRPRQHPALPSRARRAFQSKELEDASKRALFTSSLLKASLRSFSLSELALRASLIYSPPPDGPPPKILSALQPTVNYLDGPGPRGHAGQGGWL